MWGRSYYLDVQGAGDVVTRPRQCGQNGFCMIRPLSHGLDMPTSDLRDIGITEIQAKHTIKYYTFTFFSRFGHPPQWICADRCRHFTFARSLRHGKNSGLGSHRPGQVLSLVIGAQELGTGLVPGWGKITTFCWDFPTYFKGMFHLLPSCAAEDVAVWSLFGGLKRDLQSPESVCVLFMDVFGECGDLTGPLDHDLPLG